MRANPFLDAWIFLIGETDDHLTLGAFRYVLVALFVGLLIAALWLAARNWRKDAGQRTPSHVATALCRLLVGCMWFQGCLWKLPLPLSDGFKYWTGQMAQYAAFSWHRDLVTNLYLPNLSLIDPLVFLTEFSIAASLILGLGVRVLGVVAALFALHLWLGLYLHPAEWPWNYMFLALLHVLFVAHAAGRSLGADALLRRHSANRLVQRLA